ncbi:cytochrome c oxidase assembly factor 6 homolog [Antedon mediterranea]|uniref:cytochrome c oxidase assembly factor 6 homolog n=1 Tax=Antedon mediterranea TaxID=105859 RepID=UPI003AF546EB
MSKEDKNNSFPDAGQRKKCWNNRDLFFNCLDKNKDEQDKCKELKIAFESSCSKTWVKYFYRKRDFEDYKKKIEYEGFKPTEESAS